jgi:hypothetical protein
MSSYFDSNLQSFIFMPGESVVAIGTCQQWGSKTQNVPPLGISGPQIEKDKYFMHSGRL